MAPPCPSHLFLNPLLRPRLCPEQALGTQLRRVITISMAIPLIPTDWTTIMVIPMLHRDCPKGYGNGFFLLGYDRLGSDQYFPHFRSVFEPNRTVSIQLRVSNSLTSKQVPLPPVSIAMAEYQCVFYMLVFDPRVSPNTK